MTMNPSSSLYYVETDAQRSRRLHDRPNSIAGFFRKTFWAYYIHLPFYGLTNGDALCLHTFCLTLMSLGLFGVVKYCLLV